jgi:putative hydrolase of the HAD superfamily
VNAAPEHLGDSSRFDKKTVRALLFDLGGVVVDLDFQRVFRRWASEAGCNAADIASRFTQDEAYCQHERGEIDAARYFASLRTSLAIDLGDEQFLEGWQSLYLDPCDGVDLLLELAGKAYPLYAFTNSNPSHRSVWFPLLRRELSHFEAVFESCELGLRKPDTEAFHRVADLAGFRPQDFLFFDDSVENVVGARDAGMQAILVRSVEDVRAALGTMGLAVG